jgi:hypothetical protein
MAKRSRRKKDYRSNASKLHVNVGDMLKGSLFKNYRIYQEYPVNMISPYFDSGREKFDWVVMDIMTIIECHGEQHYKPVRFGGISQEEAETRFEQQKLRDIAKREAAEKAGWTYVVFKYDEQISFTSLMSKIEAFQPEFEPYEEDPSPPEKALDPNKEEKLEKARQYRRDRYRRQKEQRDADRRSKKSTS